MKTSSFPFSPRVPLLAAFALGALCQAPLALAQVPPHKPGEICVTPKLWCWARPPGPAGQPCACASPYGALSGRLG